MEKKRDKLIELIVNAKRADPETGSFTEFLADFLLGYGVFVPDDGHDLDHLRELVEADKDGRIIIIPDFVWKIGETQGVVKVPYKHWMGRFIGTKFYRTEQEAKAAQKGDPNQ